MLTAILLFELNRNFVDGTDQHSRDEEANQVEVPPDIVDDRITGDVIDNEGDNVTLKCIAKGKPNPRIVWRREDNKKENEDIQKMAVNQMEQHPLSLLLFQNCRLLQLTSTTYDSEDEGTIQR